MIDMRQRELAMVAHTQAVNAGRQPKFGDRLRNLWAGAGNPTRDATFIREVHRTGRTNPGRWYEMTDEKGKTWLSSPTGMIFCDRIEASEALGGPFAATANDGGPAMRERPILFSGPMVRAILAGTKTQTRREVKITHRTPGLAACLTPPVGEPRPRTAAEFCPYGQPGGRLWVREAHYLTDDGICEYPVFAADDEAVRTHLADIDALPATFPTDVKARHRKLRPSIHMPRWASRITLEITGVRVERLQDISADDAWVEGVQDWMGVETPWKGVLAPTEVHAFASLWESINGAGSWAANPWVWVVEFRRMAP